MRDTKHLLVSQHHHKMLCANGHGFTNFLIIVGDELRCPQCFTAQVFIFNEAPPAALRAYELATIKAWHHGGTKMHPYARGPQRSAKKRKSN